MLICLVIALNAWLCNVNILFINWDEIRLLYIGSHLFESCTFGLSGGGSALLPAPIPPVTLNELMEVTQLLARHGANIYQLNTVRKHLELMKGGGLAKAAHPAKVGYGSYVSICYNIDKLSVLQHTLSVCF